jgi:hypothetical protein
MGGELDLSPQLAEITMQVDAATERASAVIKGLTSDQLKQRVNPNSWSVAECIVHLNMTTKEYLPLLDDVLNRAGAEGPAGSRKLKMDVMGRLLKWSLEPPPRLKTKTTNQFQPKDLEPIEALLPTFVSLQDQLKSRIQTAGGLAIDKVKITSPFNDRLKYNLFSAFQILVAHERRHLWQAEQVRKGIGA